MNPLPPNYTLASTGRRFCATLVNCAAVGVIVIVGKAASPMWIPNAENGVGVRLTVIALLVIYWLVCALKKSPGAALLMLEIRSEVFRIPSVRTALLRSLPPLLVGILVCFPFQFLPAQIAVAHPLLVLTAIGGLLVNGVAILFGGRSVLDRLSKVIVLQLSLPDGQMPTILGFRIM